MEILNKDKCIKIIIKKKHAKIACNSATKPPARGRSERLIQIINQLFDSSFCEND